MYEISGAENFRVQEMQNKKENCSLQQFYLMNYGSQTTGVLTQKLYKYSSRSVFQQLHVKKFKMLITSQVDQQLRQLTDLDMHMTFIVAHMLCINNTV